MLTMEQLEEISVIGKNGFMDRLIQRARMSIHEQFMTHVNPALSETILDVGASANPTFVASNYLEFACPGHDITALGLGAENEIWKNQYPCIPYIQGNALELPFHDNSFDIVYSHAVIEHVGNFVNQVQMIREAMRVARRAIWITTPNRWHPVEFHTALPLLHWLPKTLHRHILTGLGRQYFATEDTLNLLDRNELNSILRMVEVSLSGKQILHSKIYKSKFLGFTGNLLLHIQLAE